jgi:hypothetical protein
VKCEFCAQFQFLGVFVWGRLRGDVDVWDPCVPKVKVSDVAYGFEYYRGWGVDAGDGSALEDSVFTRYDYGGKTFFWRPGGGFGHDGYAGCCVAEVEACSIVPKVTSE